MPGQYIEVALAYLGRPLGYLIQYFLNLIGDHVYTNICQWPLGANLDTHIRCSIDRRMDCLLVEIML